MLHTWSYKFCSCMYEHYWLRVCLAIHIMNIIMRSPLPSSKVKVSHGSCEYPFLLIQLIILSLLLILSICMFIYTSPHSPSSPIHNFQNYPIFRPLSGLISIYLLFKGTHITNMKISSITFGSQTAIVATILFLVLTIGRGLRVPHDMSLSSNGEGSSRGAGESYPVIVPKDEIVNKQLDHHKEKKEVNNVGNEEIYASTGGSSLPDCSHACGGCFPCKRVMVSFRCAAATESCPVVYRCMCKGKYYHVPSSS